MKTELLYLVLVTALTGLIWIPYILDRLSVWGLTDTVGYPEHPKPQTAWARRMMKAHANAIENLVVFAALVLVAQDLGISNGITAGACMIYFWARAVHLAAYTFAMPWVRTLAFTVGFFCQAAIGWQILAS
jgi:uncharacterized MAPEG superfamily protein